MVALYTMVQYPQLPDNVMCLLLFDFPQPSFFYPSFFLLLISSDIPYLQADVVSPVVSLLFFFCNTTWCVSQTTKGKRGKEWECGRREGGRGGWRG